MMIVWLFINMIILGTTIPLAMKKIVELKACFAYISYGIIPVRKVVTKLLAIAILAYLIMYSSAVMFYLTAH